MTDFYLRTRVKLLRAQLRSAEKELANFRVKECPIKVGTIVCHKRTGKKYIVRSVDFLNSPDPFRVWGSPMRKDGEWANREQSLYCDDYEVTS